MSNELQRIDNSNLIDWNCNTQLKTLKDIFGKKATNEEFNIFINLGRAAGLNPYLKEIWLIKYGTEAASIFIGRDGYRKGAQANPNYDYHLCDAVYSNDTFMVSNGDVTHEYHIADRGKLVGAYCVVKRKSSSKANFVFADLKEYDTNKSVWASKKATMIKKVAEAQCLRMAFQELFANTYCDAEYEPQDNSKQANVSKTSTKLNALIEGKAQKESKVNEIISIINNAQNMDDLGQVQSMARSLSEEEKGTIRNLYRDKKDFIKNRDEITENDTENDEIEGNSVPIPPIPEHEKIKKQLESAKSIETLQLAADLIRSCDEEYQDDLTEIYLKCADKLSPKD